MNAEIEAKMAEWREKEERAYEALCESLDNKYAWEMVESPAMLRRLFNLDGWPVATPLWVDLGDVGTFSGENIPPLSIRVRTSPDGPCGVEEVVYEIDVVAELIEGWGDPNDDESARAAFDRAYAALQGGIDRLRAYEAECLKAQS